MTSASTALLHDLGSRVSGRKRLLFLAAMVTAGATTVSTALAAEASPTLKLSSFDDLVIVSGSNFEPGEQVAITASVTGGSGSSTATVNASGHVLLAFDPPDDLTGTVKVTAKGSSDSASASMQLSGTAGSSAPVAPPEQGHAPTAEDQAAPAPSSGVTPGQATTSPSSGATSSGSTGTGSTGSGSTGSSTTPVAPSTPATPATPVATTPKTFDGDVVKNVYGSFQVKITVQDSKITKIEMPTYPNTGHSGGINNPAVPKLISEALASQGKKVSSISGATYTVDAFKQSLQSAISAADL